MNRIYLMLTLACIICTSDLVAQCSGDPTVYGTNNVWRGYLYDNMDFTVYRGWVTEGVAANPNFDESFGGSNTTYTTSNCTINTETFSARYLLNKTFASGAYEFTVGGDDGYRLSIDGGVTWIIDRWYNQSYNFFTTTVTVSGTVNMVLEYYENGGDNRVTFAVTPSCAGLENTTLFGTGNVWRGYVFDGTNFESYKGMITQGVAADPSFTQDFGGSNVILPTSGCGVQTETFSVRYRLTKFFPTGTYTFVVGADDGYRLSLDGGLTWPVNNWNDHSYANSTYSVVLSGLRFLVLDYYENSGDNRITFTSQYQTPLPIHLLSFTGTERNRTADLKWQITYDSDPHHFDLERSADGIRFTSITTLPASVGQHNATSIDFQYNDPALMSARTFYRLKMVDVNGIVTYSRIITLGAAKSEETITVFPTMIRDNHVYIRSGELKEQVKAEIFDVHGKLLSSQQLGGIAPGQSIQVRIANARPIPGLYLLRVSDPRHAPTTYKIVVQ